MLRGEYELELDSEGWVSLEQLIESLARNPKWKNLYFNTRFKTMLKTKKRYQESNEDLIWTYMNY